MAVPTPRARKLTPRRSSRATVTLAALALTAGACAHARTAEPSPPPNPAPVPAAAVPATPQPSATTAPARQLHFVQHTSTRTPQATIGALRDRAAAEGMTVTGELNPPGMHVLLLDNPQAGKLYYRANPAIGAELPVAVYVWGDQNTKARVGYFDPEDQAEAIDPNMADGCRALASTIDLITQDATGDPGTAGDPAPARFVDTTSTQTFQHTLQTLKDRIGLAGLHMIGEVNQATAMRTVGLDLPGADTLFITGAPATAAGSPPDSGPPTRLYMWVGHDKATHIGYFDPAATSTVFGPTAAQAGRRLSALLTDLTRSTP